MFNSRYLLIFLACIHTQTSLANDAFYQGAGSTLRPLYNPKMRVIEEKLWISPMKEPRCYELRFRNIVVDDWNLDRTRKAAPLKPTDFAYASEEFVCTDEFRRGYPVMDVLVSVWKARADYYVEALEDQTNVKMGFPLPIWKATYFIDGAINDLPTPSAVNFRTSINGQAITNLKLAWLEVPDPANQEKSTKTLGYTWKASFKKGEKYTLRTEYEFGTDYELNFGLYDRNNDPELWFILNNPKVLAQGLVTINLKYYLSPLLAWGGKSPEKISIFVKRPATVPITYLFPSEATPTCVDKNGLHYEYRNRYPDTELMVSVPHWFNENWKKPAAWINLNTAKQWKKWRQNLGGKSVQIACDALGGNTPALGDCVKQCSINKLPDVKF